MKFFLSILFIILIYSESSSCLASDSRSAPAFYQGRYRPLDVYASLWLFKNYHHLEIKSKDLPFFPLTSSSPIDFLFKLNFLGHEPWEQSPLFWIQHAETKKSLGLDLKKSHFSYRQIKESLEKNERVKNKVVVDEMTSLLSSIKQFEQIRNSNIINYSFKQYIAQFSTNDSTKKIAEGIDQYFPLRERLRQAGSLLKVLPGKNGDWLPLNALNIETYHIKSNVFEKISNFTLYSDDLFQQIQQLYFDIERLIKENPNSFLLSSEIDRLIKLLSKGYVPLSGKLYQKAAEKALFYPTYEQLKIESIYYAYPFIGMTISLYFLALLLMIFALITNKFRWNKGAILIAGIAFLLHTIVIGMRCFILQRPPVSNMFETVIYVPWVTVLISFIFLYRFRHSFILLASSFISIVLLIILKLTDLNSGLDNIQPVLDSQYWLIIHVLMIVGSYGVFILSGILGHLYLLSYICDENDTPYRQFLSQLTLQAMYIGVAMLIPGTILGGVWAAESWGRFWDWDPKESWAFISICIYLIWIHAYRFRKIGNVGIALGSIIGLMAISFTWYGVNYVLGTGLHSYGFGSGGTFYYYLFLLFELLFMITVFLKGKKRLKNKQKLC